MTPTAPTPSHLAALLDPYLPGGHPFPAGGARVWMSREPKPTAAELVLGKYIETLDGSIAANAGLRIPKESIDELNPCRGNIRSGWAIVPLSPERFLQLRTFPDNSLLLGVKPQGGEMVLFPFAFSANNTDRLRRDVLDTEHYRITKVARDRLIGDLETWIGSMTRLKPDLHVRGPVASLASETTFAPFYRSIAMLSKEISGELNQFLNLLCDALIERIDPAFLKTLIVQVVSRDLNRDGSIGALTITPDIAMTPAAGMEALPLKELAQLFAVILEDPEFPIPPAQQVMHIVMKNQQGCAFAGNLARGETGLRPAQHLSAHRHLAWSQLAERLVARHLHGNAPWIASHGIEASTSIRDIRPLRTEEDFTWAKGQLSIYAGNPPEAGTREADRFEVLAALVEVYLARRSHLS